MKESVSLYDLSKFSLEAAKIAKIKRANDELRASAVRHQEELAELARVARLPKPKPEPKPRPLPIAKPVSMVKLRKQYKGLVWRLTNKQDLSQVPGIEKRAFRKFDLDHIISIYEGFRLGIPAEVIASLDNLRIIPHKDNALKGIKSDRLAHPLAGLLPIG